jgi:hypothetical protein
VVSIAFAAFTSNPLCILALKPLSQLPRYFDSMDTTSPTVVAQYNAQERALCYHGNHVYEAKVLKTKIFDERSLTTGEFGPHYLVHYKGWKQKCVFLPSEVKVTSEGAPGNQCSHRLFNPYFCRLLSSFRPFHLFYYMDKRANG